MTTNNSYLIISRSSPYANQEARAALDVAFTAAAFEQEVSFVFMDDGVFQLLRKQDTQSSQLKNIGKMIPALKLYDVENVYIHERSFINAGLQQENLSDEIEMIGDDRLSKLLASANQVMVF